MTFKAFLKTSLLALGMGTTVAIAQALIHTVQKNETLSTILFNLNLKPIYGKNGMLSQTLLLNPHLLPSNGNFLLPGQKIYLASSEAESFSVTRNKQPEATNQLSLRDPSQDVTDLASASFSFSAGIDFFHVKQVDSSTNADSTVLSEATPTLGLGYNRHWDTLTTFSLIAKIQKYKLQSLGDGQTFGEDSGTKLDLAVKVMKSFSKRWNLGAGIAFEEDLFFHASSPTKLKVDKVMITKPELYADFTAFAKSNAAIGLNGKLGVNLSTRNDHYKIETGTHAGVGTFLKYHSFLKNKNYKSIAANIFYSVNDQDTSLVTRKLTNLSFMLVYDWRPDW